MKIIKKVLTVSITGMMALSSLNIVHAESDISSGKNLKQVSLENIERMPNLPSNYEMIDWLKRGKDLNDFIFDYTATNFEEKTEFSVKDGRTFSTIYRDDRYGGYMIPAFYGENRPLIDKEDGSHFGADDQESISVTSALLAASLMGIDMNKELPDELKGTVSQDVKDKDPNMLDFSIDTYLDNALKFFWTIDGTDIFTNVPNGSMSELQNMPGAYQAFDDFWYMLIANQNLYRLAEMNPNWRPEMVKGLQKKTADQMLKMVDILGNGDPSKCDFNIQGFNFKDMKLVKPVGQGRRQPDGAVGTANILYYSYKIFKESDPEAAAKYLEYTQYCMDYVDALEPKDNPYYENMLIDAVYLATMLNAEQGTNYDTSKYIKWITTTSSSSVRNWGGVNYSQDGIDAYGLTGEPNNGYSYFFNSIYPMTSILPAAKYDPSYARMAGKWAINIANSSKYFLPDQWSKEHQTDGDYIGKKEGGVMAYESLRRSGNGQNFFATGDAKQNATSGWMAGENTTNFGLYGSFYTGFLGALVKETNVEGILQLDCNKTDYYQKTMYDTYLYYNPHMESKNVDIDLGNKKYDLYDSTTGMYLAKNVSGKQTFKMLADSARVIVLAPANSSAIQDGNTTKINGILVAHSTAEVLEDQGTELIENIKVEGANEITQRGQTASYQANITPTENIMDPRVIWTVSDEEGNQTDKAMISSDGQLTVKKNGTVKIKASSIDGSHEFGEKIVKISGQTLASLSQDKKATVSSVNGSHGGNLAVDGDETTRWIADSGENNPWIYVDLGAKADINLIVLNWETARPPKYVIEVSGDKQNWTEIARVEDEGNTPKVVRFELDEAKQGRYVRVYTNQKSSNGCSLYEFDVFGNYTDITTEIGQINVTSENNVNKITTKNRPLQMYAAVNPSDATDRRVEWDVVNTDGSQTNLAEMTSAGKLIPLKNGVVKVIARAVDGSGVTGEFIVTLENQDKDNLAQGKKSFSSHQEGHNPRENAFDGKTETRWGSGTGDKNQWITVDLGDVYDVNKVMLYWESYSKKYKVQGSIDNIKFIDLYEEEEGKGGVEEKTFTAQPVRYVRIQNVERGTDYGCSLWEFQVYGNEYDKTLVESIQLSSESTENKITVKNKPLQMIATITPANATISSIEWSISDKDGKETSLATITKDGKIIPTEDGVVKVTAKAMDSSNQQAELLITITGQDAQNVALNKSADATSTSGGNETKYAIDGKKSSRWQANGNDKESITVNLEEPHYIHQVSIDWEASYAAQYKIEVSLDGINYTTIHTENNGKGSLENIYFDETLVQYVRMQGIKRAIEWGYSIYEFEVYGKSMKSDLEKKYDAIKDTDESLYTPKSYKIFKESLDKSLEVIENNKAVEADVKSALDSLNKNYQALILIANNEILEVEIKKAEAIDTKGYTAESVKVFNEALLKAKEICANKDATQKEVDEAKESLTSAIALLVKKADKTKLQELMNEIKKLKESDYTVDSYKNVIAEKAKAQKVLDNDNATEKQVTEAYNSLKAVFDALVKKPVIDVDPEKPSLEDKVIGNKNQTIFISGQLPKEIEFTSKVFNEKEIELLKGKMNPDFLKTASLEKVYDLGLLLKGVKYNPNGTMTVTLKLEDSYRNKNIGIIYIDEAGNITKIASTKDKDNIQFETSHFSTYAIVSYADTDDTGGSQPGEVELPKTSDSSPVAASIVLMMGAGVIYMLLRKKKAL